MIGRIRIGTVLTLSRVIFGCTEFEQTGAEARIRTLHAAYDAGITSFDLAPRFGLAAAEELLGRAIADRRGRVELLTKVGLRWSESRDPAAVDLDDERARRAARRDARAGSVRQSVTASLRRLGVETIDLVHVHQADRRTPFAETFGALADLCREGKVRAVGVSGFSAAEVREAAAALGSTPLASIQVPYNLLDRQAEAELIPLARQRGLAVLAHSPLAEGLLGGRQRELQGEDLPPWWQQGSPYFRARVVGPVNEALDQAVRPIARERVTSPAAISLAWVLARPGVTAAIAGARTPSQVEELVDGSELRLSVVEHERLGRSFLGVDLSAPSPLLEEAARRARSLLAKVRSLTNRR
jgi:aryl-alcohol dehydrogenase-like predicted oxidoreductase